MGTGGEVGKMRDDGRWVIGRAVLRFWGAVLLGGVLLTRPW